MTRHSTIATIEGWTLTGSDDDPHNRMLATLLVDGYPMHLEALAVTVDEDSGVKTAEYVERREDLDTLEVMHDTRFQTTTIDGREYILYAVPFGT